MRPIIKKIWSNDIAELTDRLKRIKSTIRANAKYFVFKCSDTLSQIIDEDCRARREILDRSQGKSTYLLRYASSINSFTLLEVTEHKLLTINNNSFLDEIRSFDLGDVIEHTQGECFIDAPDNTHFITPSGKHTIRFLRLTDAIYSYNALDRISFWLQPYIANSSAVLIDTWSLSSIILRAQQLLDKNIPFDCFHEHVICNDELALSTLNKISRRIEGTKPILILVGISSSGSFIKALPNLVANSNIDNELIALSIYGFSNIPDDINTLAKLGVQIDWFDKDNCEYCSSENRKNTYQIDTKYYYPRKYEEKVIRFTKYLLMEEDKKTQSSASVFIHKYGAEKGVLTVHKNDPNDGITPRHHAFYINVKALMVVDEFVKEVIFVAKNIESKCSIPDMVIFPPHAAAKSIAESLRSIWPRSEFIFNHNLRVLSDESKKLLQEAEHICFVDDVSITGSRIESYLRVLREDIGGDVLGKLKNITWFPLVLRGSSEADIKRIQDSLYGHDSHWKNNLTYVHKIILPDWSGDGDCPWCKEEAVLDKHIGPLWDEPEWYKERRTLLRNKDKGIEENPLLVSPFSGHKALGSASALGDEGLSEIQVVFLIANGLQRLRTQHKSALGVDDLIVKYVLSWENNEKDPKCGTFSRFSEPFIQSCFLRTVRPDEWSRNVWGSGKTFIGNKIESGNSNELIGETLLFYLRRGGDKLEDSTINYVRKTNDDEAILSLLDALRNNQPNK